MKVRELIEHLQGCDPDADVIGATEMALTSTVPVPIPSDTLRDLTTLVQSCNEAGEVRGGVNTHGRLSVPTLLVLLAEDVGRMVSHPKSWEAAYMVQVLLAHGYEFHSLDPGPALAS